MLTLKRNTMSSTKRHFKLEAESGISHKRRKQMLVQVNTDNDDIHDNDSEAAGSDGENIAEKNYVPCNISDDENSKENEIIFVCCDEDSLSDTTSDPPRVLLSHQVLKSSEGESSGYKEVGIQADTGFLTCGIANYITSDKDLFSSTGLLSVKLLDVVVKAVTIALKGKKHHSLSETETREKVLLTLMKLKQNISFEFLSLIFQKYSASHCRTIFLEMLIVLAEVLDDMKFDPKYEKNVGIVLFKIHKTLEETLRFVK